MALIKTKTDRRQTGDYWIIAQRNRSRVENNLVVTLVCYQSKQARQDDKAAGVFYPTNMQAQFNFVPGDHPLDDVEPDAINPEWINDPENVETHLVYLHIKAVAQISAQRQAENTELTPNEQVAIWFADAQDDVP
jgi:hypothetical protein